MPPRRRACELFHQLRSGGKDSSTNRCYSAHDATSGARSRG
jgi:hypothetical protein